MNCFLARFKAIFTYNFYNNSIKKPSLVPKLSSFLSSRNNITSNKDLEREKKTLTF